MSGFLFKLKGSGIKKPGLKQGLKKGRKAFGEQDIEDDRIAIEAFEKGSDEPQQLVIKPVALNNKIKRPERKVVVPKEEKLNFGLNTFEKEGEEKEKQENERKEKQEEKIEENVEDDDDESDLGLADLPDEDQDYEKVPVDDFGAAMLRGMGWKSNKPKKPRDLKQRKGAVLGIGAKPEDEDLMEEIMAKRNAKFLIPVKRKDV